MPTKPNILFIQVDQLTAASLRFYGDPVCVAPTLDHLAETGAVFDTAYCNFPLCAPSRFSMAAGQLCSRIGAYDNAAEMPASVPTYAHYLRSAGYQTALSGKMHFIGPDQHHGFEKRLTADIYPADFSWVPSWGNEGKRDTNDTRSVLTSGVCRRSVQIDFDEMVTFQAVQHLYDMARSNDERPFFLQVSYTHPHDPYLCSREYWDLYRDADIPMPRVGPLDADEHDAHSLRLLKSFGLLGVHFSDEDVRRARRAYYGSISYIDGMVRRLLDALKAIDADRHTVVVFASDHGEMLGERGMWFKKHFFEPSLRVPLVISAPWIKPQRVREHVSLVDLLPTFMGLAREAVWKSPVEDLEGVDLTGFLDGHSEAPTRAVYAEYLAESTTAPIFMIRRDDYKFITSADDLPLLFNVANDPDERVNLASQPEYSDVITAFQAEAAAKWDSEHLSRQVLLSQRRRRLILDAQEHGQVHSWNHDEAAGQDTRWYRGAGGYNEWALRHMPERLGT